MHLPGKPAAIALVAAAFLVVGLLGTPEASSQTISRYVIGNGGMLVIGPDGKMTHGGTVGQSIVGISDNPSSELDVYHGFWPVPQPDGPSSAPTTGDAGLAALQNAPNPFSSSTNISFTIPSRSEVTLRVYDMEGKLVRTLADGSFTPGQHSVNWNALDTDGEEVASGYYYYALDARPTDAGGQAVRSQQKMLLMK